MNKISLKFILCLPVLLLPAFSGCGNNQMRNFNAIPSFSSRHVNAVIEIPAGTNQRIKYFEMEKMFLIDHESNGGVIDFLPCPGNYGFIPSTFMDPVMGGDGDPVKIFVISEHVPTGTVMEVIPLLVLFFGDGQENGGQLNIPKIIAVPASVNRQVIKAQSYEDMFSDYPGLVDMLVNWFISSKISDGFNLEAIGDGEVAIEEIEKWEIRRF
jgi:inorganic pyrophosphatase